MPVTLNDLAQKSGLNISTISRALRNDERVKEKTVAMVKELAKEMGYRPNLTARNLAAGSTRTIWFLVPSFPYQMELELAEFAGPLAREEGYDLLISLFYNDGEVFTHLLNRLGQGVTDAAIIMPGGEEPSEEMQQLVAGNFPMVFVDRSQKKVPVPVVTTDQESCSRELVERCVAEGVNGLVVYFENENDVLRNRYKGAIEAVEASGLPWVATHELDKLKMESLSSCKKLGMLANAGFDLHIIIRRQPEFFRGKSLVFACYDIWQGEPYPAEKVIVCRQNFRTMAKEAIKQILKQLKSKETKLRKKTIKVPAKSFDEITPSL